MITSLHLCTIVIWKEENCYHVAGFCRMLVFILFRVIPTVTVPLHTHTHTHTHTCKHTSCTLEGACINLLKDYVIDHWMHKI